MQEHSGTDGSAYKLSVSLAILDAYYYYLHVLKSNALLMHFRN